MELGACRDTASNFKKKPLKNGLMSIRFDELFAAIALSITTVDSSFRLKPSLNRWTSYAKGKKEEKKKKGKKVKKKKKKKRKEEKNGENGVCWVEVFVIYVVVVTLSFVRSTSLLAILQFEPPANHRSAHVLELISWRCDEIFWYANLLSRRLIFIIFNPRINIRFLN